MNAIQDYETACQRLQREVTEAGAAGQRIRLRKDTSNLFRRQNEAGGRAVDVRSLNRVLRIDPDQRLAVVEGMLTYEDFVDATLPHGLLPAVVPQLKTITVGGAVSGLGIESSSFRYGLVHETVESMDILLGNGTIAHCSRRENPDLFFGFPNTYGTLGFILRLTVRLIPAEPYVHVTHTQFSDPGPFFQAMTTSDADYVDGTIFDRDEIFFTEGRFKDRVPHISDYTFMKIYYQSIRRCSEDWMTTHQYIWRWDTDWFWCSKQFHLQNRALRWIAKPWLNSRSYQRWMRLARRCMPDRGKTESVIQDVQIPLENAETFFDFLLTEIPITPIWVCPFRTSIDEWTLTALKPSQIYINFGFWDVIPRQGQPGHFNRKIEQKIGELEGTKGLYSTAYYDEAEFWRIYDPDAYKSLKAKADPRGVLPDLFATVARRN